MKIYKGQIKMLGKSSNEKKHSTYSIIEIGDNILKNIVVSDELDNFLSRSLNSKGESTLYLNYKALVGIKSPDGKLYCQNIGMYKIILLSVFCAAFIAVGFSTWGFLGAILSLVIAFPLTFGLIGELVNLSITNKLKAQGAISV